MSDGLRDARGPIESDPPVRIIGPETVFPLTIHGESLLLARRLAAAEKRAYDEHVRAEGFLAYSAEQESRLDKERKRAEAAEQDLVEARKYLAWCYECKTMMELIPEQTDSYRCPKCAIKHTPIKFRLQEELTVRAEAAEADNAALLGTLHEALCSWAAAGRICLRTDGEDSFSRCSGVSVAWHPGAALLERLAKAEARVRGLEAMFA